MLLALLLPLGACGGVKKCRGACTGQFVRNYPDGSHYTGMFVGGKRHGLGVLKTDKGVYVGDFRDDQPHGLVYHKHRRVISVGEFAQGQPTGIVLTKKADGSAYVGGFVAGKREGLGVQRYKSGAVFAGDWQADGTGQFGAYEWSEGDYYVGQWKGSKVHGNGVYFYSDKQPDGDAPAVSEESGPVQDFRQYYSGLFVNGRKNGPGYYHRRDGSFYIGQWRNDGYHDGLTYDAAGELRGRWVSGRFATQ